LKLALLVFLANLPDLDFFTEFGFHANELHRGFTHSLSAAIVVSLGLSCLWRIVPGFWRSALLYFTAYGSHLLIDLCTGRSLGWNNSGYGIPLFWPWHQEFASPLILVFGVRHKNLSALFSIDNAWSCAYELLIFGAITSVLFSLWKRKQKSQTNQVGPETGELRHSELQYHS
jgi:membrane-bound metal-dependent hydrolase YbcI (DUF457 family)